VPDVPDIRTPPRRSVSNAALLALCASQELTLAARSRATQAFALVFAALALGVALSGYILSGGSGMQDFARTSASLLQLTVLLVPMMALVTGTAALSPDRGAAELLLSQPIERRVVLWGKLLGLFEALAAAQALGFGASGLVIFSQSGSDGIAGFLWLVAASLALTAVFLGLAALIAGAGARRARSIALALTVWFVAVLLFDLVALGVASLLHSGPASRVLMVASLVNPVDAVRTGTLMAVEGTAAFGAASLALLRFTGGPGRAIAIVIGSVVVWTVVPLLIAARRFERADI
jgi:Cu-processing system permease protein